MSQAKGLNSAFGVGIESTPGTRVVPSIFLELPPSGYKGGLKQTTNAKPTLNSPDQRYYVKSKQDISSSVELYMPFQGAEQLIKAAMGGSVGSATQGAEGLYRHTFALGNDLPSLSLYRSVDFTALSKLFSHNGSKVKKMTFTQEMEEFLKVGFEFVGMNETLPTSAATVTYPTFYGVDYTMLGTLTIGGQSYNIKACEISLENPLEEDSYKLGSRTRILVDRNAPRKVSGKFTVYLDAAAIYELFSNQTESALSFIWTSSYLAVGSASYYRMAITVPRVVFQGDAPEVEDHGPVMIELPFEAYYNGSADAITIALDNLLTSVS